MLGDGGGGINRFGGGSLDLFVPLSNVATLGKSPIFGILLLTWVFLISLWMINSQTWLVRTDRHTGSTAKASVTCIQHLCGLKPWTAFSATQERQTPQPVLPSHLQVSGRGESPKGLLTPSLW